MRSVRRQVSLGSKDEPSNPFKNPKKSTPAPKNSTVKSPRRDSSRSKSGPPAPPGGRKQSPPVAPSRTKANDTSKQGSNRHTPVRAGKSVGLRKQTDKAKSEAQKKTDERARAFIEASRVKVTQSQAEKKAVPSAKQEPTNPFKKNQAQRPKTSPQQRRGGRFNKRNKPQGPSKRVHKLHRGKYMEFKYDVRRILEEENVEDEHKSNVLGQTWAKGERQGVTDAKTFLEEKVSDGIITEKCSKRIIKLIDSLTTRR